MQATIIPQCQNCSGPGGQTMGYSVNSTAGLAYYVSQVYVEPEEPLGMLSITVRPNLVRD